MLGLINKSCWICKSVDYALKNGGNVIAVIPTQGLGSRLFPLTNGFSKALLRVGDTPILYRLLNSFAKTNVKDVVLIVNPDDNSVKEFLSVSSFDFNIETIERTPDGYLSDLYFIYSQIKSSFVCLDCDLIVSNQELRNFIQNSQLIAEECDLVIGTTFNKPTHDPDSSIGIMENPNGTISILGRGVRSSLHIVPTFYWTERGLEDCKKFLDQGIKKGSLYLSAISKTHKIKAFYYTSAMDVDTIDDLQLANEYLNTIVD